MLDKDNTITINVSPKLDKQALRNLRAEILSDLNELSLHASSTSKSSGLKGAKASDLDRAEQAHVTASVGKALNKIKTNLDKAVNQMLRELESNLKSGNITSDKASAVKDRISGLRNVIGTIHKSMIDTVDIPAQFSKNLETVVSATKSVFQETFKFTGGLKNSLTGKSVNLAGRYLELLGAGSSEGAIAGVRNIDQLRAKYTGDKEAQRAVDLYGKGWSQYFKARKSLNETIAMDLLDPATKSRMVGNLDSVRNSLMGLNKEIYSNLSTDKDNIMHALADNLATAKTTAAEAKQIIAGSKTKRHISLADREKLYGKMRDDEAAKILASKGSVPDVDDIRTSLKGDSFTSDEELKNAQLKRLYEMRRQVQRNYVDNAKSLIETLYGKSFQKDMQSFSGKYKTDMESQLSHAAMAFDKDITGELNRALEVIKNEADPAKRKKLITKFEKDLSTYENQYKEFDRLINEVNSKAAAQKVYARTPVHAGAAVPTGGGGATGGGGGGSTQQTFALSDSANIERTIEKVKQLHNSYSDIKRIFKDGNWDIFSKVHGKDLSASELGTLKRSLTEQGAQMEKNLGLQKSRVTVEYEISKILDIVTGKMREGTLYQKKINELTRDYLMMQGKSKGSPYAWNNASAASSVINSLKAGTATVSSVGSGNVLGAQIGTLTAERKSNLKGIVSEDKMVDSAEKQVTDTIQKQLTAMREAESKLRALSAAKQKLRTDTTLTKQEVHGLTTFIGNFERELQNTTNGLGKNHGAFKKLGDGIGGVVTTMMEMAKWQSVWYISKGTVFAIPQLIGQGVEYAKTIDEMRFKLIRWGATSGEVTSKMRADVDSLAMSIRKTLLTVPGDFKETLTTSESLIGAGMPLKEVEKLMPTLTTMKSAFPEIDFEKFSVAAMGAFNVFKDGITGASDDAGKFKILMEQLLRAQAESIARPEHFTKIMQYMSEMGKIAGMTAGEVFALSTTIADTGVTTSQSSRLLSGFITQLSRTKTMEGLNKLFSLNNVSKDNMLSKQLPLFENLKRTMRGLREMGFTEKTQPTGVFSFLQSLIPKEEIKVFGALVDRYEDFIKRIASLEKSGGSIEALTKEKQNTISGQMALLKHTLNEISLSGNVTAQGFGMIIASGLDAARGALLALNPELAKGSIQFDQLGTVGRITNQSIKVLSDVMVSGAQTIGPFVKALIDIVSTLTRIPGLIQAITFAGLIAAIGKLTGAFTLAGLAAQTMGTKSKTAALDAEVAMIATSRTASTSAATSAAKPGVSANNVGAGVLGIGIGASILGSMIDDKGLSKLTTDIGNMAVAVGVLIPLLPQLKLGLAALGGTAVLGPLGIALGAIYLIPKFFDMARESIAKADKEVINIINDLNKLPNWIDINVKLNLVADEMELKGGISKGLRQSLLDSGVKPEQLNKILDEAQREAGKQGGDYKKNVAEAIRSRTNRTPGDNTPMDYDEKPYGKDKKGDVGTGIKVPPDVGKGGGDRANLEASIRNVQLDMLKTHLDMVKSLYTEFYNWGFINSEQFFAEETDNLKRSYEEEYKVIVESYEKIKKARGEDKERAKNGKAESAEVDKSYNLKEQKDALDHKNKLVKLTADMIKKTISLLKSYHTDRLALIDEANALESVKEQHRFNLEKAGSDHRQNILNSEIDWRRSLYLISEKDYFEHKEREAGRTKDIEIAAANMTLENWRRNNKTKLDALKEGANAEYMELMSQVKAMQETDITPERYKEISASVDKLSESVANKNIALLKEVDAAKLVRDSLEQENTKELAVTSAIYKHVEALKALDIQKRTPQYIYEKGAGPYEKGAMGVVKYSMDETAAEMGKVGVNLNVMTKNIFSGLSDNFKTFFVDVFKGELKSGSDYFEAFCDTLLNSMAQFGANSLVGTFLNMFASGAGAGGGAGIAGAFGGGVTTSMGGVGGTAAGAILSFLSAHTGGYIMHSGGFIPRFHSGGLNSDEVPAILQKGEYVVSRRGVQALDRLNSGNVSASPVVNLNIIDNNNSKVSAEKSSDNQNNVDLNVMIDKAVANNLGKFGTKSNRAVRNTFNTTQRLANRG